LPSHGLPSISASAINHTYSDNDNESINVDIGILGAHLGRHGGIKADIKHHHRRRNHTLQEKLIDDAYNANESGTVDTGIFRHHENRKDGKGLHFHSLQDESIVIESSTKFNRSAYHRSLFYEEYCTTKADTCSDFCACSLLVGDSKSSNLLSEVDYGECIRDLCLGGNAAECLGQYTADNMCRDVRCLKHASWGQCGCQWYMNNYDVSKTLPLRHCCKMADIYGVGHGICVLSRYLGLSIYPGDLSELTEYTYGRDCINPDTCSDFCKCHYREYNNINQDYYQHGIYDPSKYFACYRDVCFDGRANACLANGEEDICNEVDAECIKNGSWEKCMCQKLVNDYEESMSDSLSSDAKAQILCCKKKDSYGRGWNLCLYYQSLGITLADAINTIEIESLLPESASFEKFRSRFRSLAVVMFVWLAFWR